MQNRILFLGYLTLSIFTFSCKQERKMFKLLPAEETGITFSNRITESDSLNIFSYQYIYNGGGVAIADFNNDNKLDIFFTANVANCELYLNEGNFKFRNISQAAGVTGEGRWCSGVSVVDINLDGWQDIYISATAHPDINNRTNILYINQGLNEHGIPEFIDMADDYNLADTTYTTHTSFFDYDNDGDLDAYLLVSKFDEHSSMNKYHEKWLDGESENTDRLYRNEGIGEDGHPYFKDVSREAGITIEGYGLGVNTSDVNQDGWVDVYVTNDFLTNDILYINNGDGTFTDRASECFKHTAHSAMGNNISDINNDGHPDIIALDMLPEDNYRKKMMFMPIDYRSYTKNEQYNYDYQFIRNQLQLYQGKHPDTGLPVYSDVGIQAGIAATDWSWSPVVGDMDNDGWRDVIITNGFPKDITDHDFDRYSARMKAFASDLKILEEAPNIKISNYAYRNDGGYTFKDVTNSWGMDVPLYSNGAVCADLDNDGDLDFVVNNINDSASVFRNQRSDNQNEGNNYIRFSFNRNNGIGTKIKLEYDSGKIQYYEHTPFRGYLSSMEPKAHFGVGKSDAIDKVTVIWPDSSFVVLQDIGANQEILIEKADASKQMLPGKDSNNEKLFRDVKNSLAIDYIHNEQDFIDYKIQPLLPHKFSQYGPGLAVSDVDGDALADVYVSGSSGRNGTFFVQRPDGTFVEKNLFHEKKQSSGEEELGSLFFDADGDGDKDLYIVSGGYEHKPDSKFYQDRFFINHEGTYHHAKNALPISYTSGSCVRAADYDRDGDLDLFIGGRVRPHEYPKPVSSYILENVSTNEEVKFDDVTSSKAPALNNIGMISDALWTDFNNDGWIDLVLTGEWMPVTFLKNEKGKLIDITRNTGIADKIGWWNSLCAGDFDLDGDTDYIVGNLGNNTFFNASDQYPLSVYANDFDNNGVFDVVPTIYLKLRKQDDALVEVPYYGMRKMGEQIKLIFNSFNSYDAYASSTFKEIISTMDTAGMMKLQANYMATSMLENLGSGKFDLTPLAQHVQRAPVFGMLSEDVNDDGLPDVLLTGNDYGMEITNGRCDALNGLVLVGKGNGEFDIHDFESTGFFVPGDAKALVGYSNGHQALNVWASQNRDSLKCFRSNKRRSAVPVLDEDAYAIVHLQNGRSFKKEFYYGSGFLSQSARFLFIPDNCTGIEIISFTGKSRTISRNDLTVK